MSEIKEAISFNDFSAHYPEKSEPELTKTYTEYLIERRQAIAEAYGLDDVQDLHYFLGGVATEAVRVEEAIV
jgi:hypothetical protein